MCVLVFCKQLCQWISQGSMFSWPADSVSSVISSVNWLLGSMEFRWRWKSCMRSVRSTQHVCRRIISKSGVQGRKRQGLKGSKDQHLS